MLGLHRRLGALAGAAIGLSTFPTGAQPPPKPDPDPPPLFARVGAGAGVDVVTVSGDPAKPDITGSLGSGAALFDYDADGDLDLYVVNGARSRGVEISERMPNRLLRNEGQWRFRDVTEEAHLGDLGWGMGCASGDFDNDGLPDLYVTNLGANSLYRNLGDGTFRDVTDSAGVGDPGWGTSAAWLDADGDGDLDLYVVNYLDPAIRRISTRPTAVLHASGVVGDVHCRFEGVSVFCGPAGFVGGADAFYRNEGNGEFTLSTRAAGLDDSSRAFGLGVVTLDFDDDGATDLYVANDAMPNFLYRNTGAVEGRIAFEEVGVFAGVAYDAQGRAQAGMGVDAADVDGDGLIDLFVTNFANESNTVYVNQGGGLFADRTEEIFPGRPSFLPLGWATAFTDLDLDGDQDLFVANGHVFPRVDDAGRGSSYAQSNQVFENRGGRFFVWPLPETDASLEQRSSRGAAFGDLDDDGRMDVVVVDIDAPISVLRHVGITARRHHWVGLRLVGRAANRDARGSRVVLSYRGGEQRREVHASGYLSSNDPRIHFGLGRHDRVDRLRIFWPDGTEQHLDDLAADLYHTVVQTAATAPRPRVEDHLLEMEDDP